MSESEEQARFFVRTWAEAVLRQAARARTIRRTAEQDSRNCDRMEDWSPPLHVLEENFRNQWAEEHQLIWAAHQLERWDARLCRERGQQPRPEDPFLKTIRDALEHLDEVNFANGQAVAPPILTKRDKYIGRALRDLSGGVLDLALGGGTLVGGILPQAIEERGLQAVRAVEEELAEEQLDEYAALLHADERDPDLEQLLGRITAYYEHPERLAAPFDQGGTIDAD
ncbi:hypothetical protein ACFP51_32705 [Streptomyces pratens]|uniref:DUF4254 domain-containing protein n=1 Tax=Streptomyces pratens TaxID=887456 RepID=A0ABW1MC04_9ACTN